MTSTNKTNELDVCDRIVVVWARLTSNNKIADYNIIIYVNLSVISEYYLVCVVFAWSDRVKQL